MFRISLVIFFIHCFLFIDAQDKIEKHSLTLNDGTYLIGEIIDNSEDTISIKLLDKITYQFHKNEIKKIKPHRPNYFFLENGKCFKDKGLNYQFSVGYNIVTDGDGMVFQNKVAYFINPSMSIGLGAGIDNYNRERSDDIPFQIPLTYRFLPIYAHTTKYIYNNIENNNPYISLGVGYSIPMKPSNNFNNFQYNGGFTLNTSVGIRVASFRGMNFFFETGYRLQKVVGEYETYDWQSMNYLYVTEAITFQRLFLSVGWIF